MPKICWHCCWYFCRWVIRLLKKKKCLQDGPDQEQEDIYRVSALLPNKEIPRKKGLVVIKIKNNLNNIFLRPFVVSFCCSVQHHGQMLLTLSIDFSSFFLVFPLFLYWVILNEVSNKIKKYFLVIIYHKIGSFGLPHSRAQ